MRLLESFFLLNLGIFLGATIILKSLEGFSVVECQAALCRREANHVYSAYFFAEFSPLTC